MLLRELKKKSYVPVAIRRLLTQDLREKLYLCFSKLFPDPQKEPDWYDPDVKRRIAREEVSQGFDDQGDRMFLKPGEAKLFYNRYVVPRMEGYVHEPLEEQVTKPEAESVKPQKPGVKGEKKAKKSTADLQTPSQVQTSPKTPDLKLVEAAVAFINEKANEALYKYSIEIGDYILEKFFDGDTKAASSRNPRKFVSYRALCKHRDLGPSPGALSVMVRVAAQEKLFEAKKLPVEKLSYSHKAELVKIYDDDTKLKLFKEAVKTPLTVRQLQDRIRDEKGLVPSTQVGQGLDGRVTRFNFESLLKTRALSDEETLKALPEKRRNELKERVEGAYTILEHLLEEYGRLKDLFANLDKS